MEEPTTWDKFTTGANEVLFGPVAEIYAMMPDSLLYGSLVIYLLTQNMPFGVFSLFIFEMSLLHRMISWMFEGSVGPSRPVTNARCRAGYKIPQYVYERMFSKDQYPAYSIFSISSIATYMGLSLNEFTDTMVEMGPDWSKRIIVGYTFIGFMLLAFLSLRAYHCGDQLGEIIVAVFLAIVAGFLLFHLHKKVFGIESVNFLGLPYLIRKDEKGKDIYVCAAQEIE
jgi:hypothetical protein